MLPLPCFITVAQSGEDTDAGIHPTHDIRDADTHFHWWTISLTRKRHDPTVALRHQTIAGQIAVRTRLTVARDRTIYNLRVHFTHALVIKTILNQSPRFEVLDDHIRLFCDLMDQRLALRGREIRSDRIFVAIGRHEVSAKITLTIRRFRERWPPSARIIAPCFGVLNLEHRRAHVTKQLCCCRPCENTAKVEDGQTIKRTFGVRGVRHSFSYQFQRRSG